MTRFLVAREMFAEDRQAAIRGRFRVDTGDGQDWKSDSESKGAEDEETGESGESLSQGTSSASSDGMLLIDLFVTDGVFGIKR